MSDNNEIRSFPPSMQNLVEREVKRQVQQALKEAGLLQDDKPLDGLPILQAISAAPRDVPLSVRLHLRLCSSAMPFFGWFIAGFGLIFALVAVVGIGLDDAIPRSWKDVGKGKITNVEETNTTYNDRKIYAYHFELNDLTGEMITGTSHGFKGKYETGNDVVIEKAGERYRVQGLTLTGVPGFFPWIFFGAGCLFSTIGLCFPIYSWFTGGKTIHILREGTAIGARYKDTTPTNMSVNKQPVMNVNFEYQVDGEKYTASATALDTSRPTDTKIKVILYDPMQPNKSVVLDGLPRGIHLDELTGQFRTNPLRCLLPLLAATIVGGQIVAIVVLALRAI